MPIRSVLSQRTWFLQNLDTNQIFQSQFEAEGLTLDVKANYGKHTSLSRFKPVIQFLNKEADTVSFQATLYRQNVIENTVEEDFALLKSWVQQDELARSRPPILLFWVGDSHFSIQCVLEGLTGVTYHRPTMGGGVRRIDFTVNLLEYEEYSLDDSANFETLYYRAKDRDYYELIAQRLYGSPLKGDVIRKRNPSKPHMQIGDQIPFPNVTAIRKDVVEPKSIALSTAFGKKITPQKANRIDMFDRRNKTYVSHILTEY